MKQRTLKLFALIFFVLAGVMAFINSGHAQKSQMVASLIDNNGSIVSPQSRAADLLAPRSLAQQQGDKPAEQGKGQGKQGVAELDQLEVVTGSGEAHGGCFPINQDAAGEPQTHRAPG